MGFSTGDWVSLVTKEDDVPAVVTAVHEDGTVDVRAFPNSWEIPWYTGLKAYDTRDEALKHSEEWHFGVCPAATPATAPEPAPTVPAA